MKYYPVHVLIKDFSFWVIFFLTLKFIDHHDYFFQTEWWTSKEIIGTSLYMTLGIAIINILILTIPYFVLKTKKQSIRSFWFGAALHIISLFLIGANIELEGRILNFLVAAMISMIVSGKLYQKLNSEIGVENQIRKCFGLE